MLYYENLEEIVFTRHEIIDSSELIVLSGYLGPTPVAGLETLPIAATVIYGMYGSEGISAKLHNSLVKLDGRINNVDIKYSNIPIHSKCYAWKKDGKIVHALVGSANFSTNGLCTPFREILAETTKDTFRPLNAYIAMILENSISCNLGVVRAKKTPTVTSGADDFPSESVCSMVLYNPKTGEVQNGHGLNWGLAAGSHVRPDDANIPIRADYVRKYPGLFPEKMTLPRAGTKAGRAHRHNDAIEIIWDDGTSMSGLLEGNYQIDGKTYPKQISSFPAKSLLGRYIRRRLGVPSGRKVTMRDLRNYGRSTIDVSLQGEGIYYFDFSINTQQEE